MKLPLSSTIFLVALEAAFGLDGSLSTGFTGTANSVDGNIFEIKTKDYSVTIESMDIHMTATTAPIAVWYRPGEMTATYVDTYQNAIEVETTGNGPNAWTQLPPFQTPIVLPAGTTHTFYVTASSNGAESLYYGIGTSFGQTFASDDFIEVTEGYALRYSFSSPASPRQWNGVIHYTTNAPAPQTTPSPTKKPTNKPTPTPTRKPISDTLPPTFADTLEPTVSINDTLEPSNKPTPTPTRKPISDTLPPTFPDNDTLPPTKPWIDTLPPTTETPLPTASPLPTDSPTDGPTLNPTKFRLDTLPPTVSPYPTSQPTASPTVKPTRKPTAKPTLKPVAVVPVDPNSFTESPTSSHAPSESPTVSSSKQKTVLDNAIYFLAVVVALFI